MLGVFAEFERAMIRERVMAGLSRAKVDGIQLGRRRLEDSNADKVAAIVAARAKGTGIRRIARELGRGCVGAAFFDGWDGDQLSVALIRRATVLREAATPNRAVRMAGSFAASANPHDCDQR
jgi:hypothetical protein